MNAVDDAVKTMDAAIDEIVALRMERDDWKGRYDTLLAIWEELRAENDRLRHERNYAQRECEACAETAKKAIAENERLREDLKDCRLQCGELDFSNVKLREALPAFWGQYDDEGRKLWVDPADALRAENERLRKALHDQEG